MKFILLIGIPGSGKSTVAEGLIAKGYMSFNADHIREELYGDAMIQGDPNEVFGLMYERLEEALIDEKDIVIDNTNVRKSNRRTLIALAKQYGYTDIELWIMDIPLKTCILRNSKRTRVVPEDIIVNMQKILDENRVFFPLEGTVITLKDTDQCKN